MARWKKEVGREPNGLPYTQYLYDAPYLVAAVFKSLDDKKMPITGENFRKEMLAMKTFDLPLTGKTTIGDDHTVVKPVYLMEVKGGKWTQQGDCRQIAPAASDSEERSVDAWTDRSSCRSSGRRSRRPPTTCCSRSRSRWC